MRPTKKCLIFQDDAGDDDILGLARAYVQSTETLVTSYHNLDNPLLHRVINTFDWEELVILPTSEADIRYAELILRRVGKVRVLAGEEEYIRYFNTFAPFIPEKSAAMRKAVMMGKPITDIINS